LSDPNAGVIQILRRTRPWVYFLSLFGFSIVGVISALGIASLVGVGSERIGRDLHVVALFVYPLMVIVWLVPSFYLHKYARRIRTFVAQGHQVQLEAALEAQRHFWLFTGAMALAMAGLTCLAVIAGAVMGFMARAN
jgi:hypothetical protein